MIRFFDKNDKNAVISLWKEAFGDSEEVVSVFLNRFGKYMLVFEENNTVISMLTVLPVKLNEKKGRYVYAVATRKEFRGNGYAGRLIEYAKRLIEEKNESFLVILPQSESLFGFYEKFGFSELKCAVPISEKVSFETKSNITADEITAKEYFECRKRYFKGKNYVEWSIEKLEFFAEIYNGIYLKILENGEEAGYAFCYFCENKLIMSELLIGEDKAGIIGEIGRFFGKEEIIGVRERKNGERFAMIYPKELDYSYFGIGMN